MRIRLLPAASMLLFVTESASLGHAQWVAVARAVSGRIQQMQQKSADGKGGYDSQTASLQANPLGDKLTQLVVASTLDPTQPSATSLVVKSIENVCTELKVECTLQTQ